MPGLVILAVTGAVYDVLAIRHGWETITGAVKRLRRHPDGERGFQALVAHFGEQR